MRLPAFRNDFRNRGYVQLRMSNVEIVFHRGGSIVIFIHRRGNVRAYAIDLTRIVGFIRRSPRQAFAMVLLSVVSVGAIIALQRDVITLEIDGGVGGFGAIDPVPAEKKVVDKDIERSELLKDALMGDSGAAGLLTEGGGAQKISYTVKSGETLRDIASRFDVSTETIAIESKIEKTANLKAGQKLNIPTRNGFFYTIKKGDRLAAILNQHRVTLEKFFAENPGVDLDLLQAGAQVFLPDAKPIRIIPDWLVPVASRIITSPFGYRTWPRAAFHKGLDLKALYAPVKAAKSGTVSYAGWLGGYGKVVVITHPGGYKTLYAHLSSIYVKDGMQVAAGRALGISGDTGYSFGPHLHFEVTKNGQHINPAKLLKGLRRRRG